MASPAAAAASAFPELRQRLLAAPGPPGPARRRELAQLADAWLAGLYERAVGPERAGVALVAVGGFGRGELSPGSDLDLLLLHEADTAADRGAVARIADALWYPVWDAGVRLDHAVRTPQAARRLAGDDLAVLLGLLDLRTVAGDPRLGPALRAAVLADWRTAARRRLPALQEAWRKRAQRSGEVAHDVEPDLKEGRGGLRDATVLRAVAASWLADHPHAAVDAAVRRLLDVRDALHLVTGRASDRLVRQEQDAVAHRLELPDGDAALAEVSASGRVIAYAGELTWRRVEGALSAGMGRRRSAARPPMLRPVAAGLVERAGELGLAPGVAPEPVLPLRAAATAARHGLVLPPAVLERLAAECPPLPEPWPPAAREALLALLGSGPALVPVWEALDQAGIVVRLLPEWAGVRDRPQRSPVHRWTVDRHLVETAAAAAGLARRVGRPDLLLLAALLHDLGKRGPAEEDHAVVGARLAGPLAARLGLPAADVHTVTTLVREHLLLSETATQRDLDDPATVAAVVDRVGSVAVLDLLEVLTEADATATGTPVWSPWRARLVTDLARRARGFLQGQPPPRLPALTPEQRRLASEGRLGLQLEDDDADTFTLTVVAPDRQGLLAAVAGVLALHRLSVRSATLRTEAGMAVDVWSVQPEYGDPPRLDGLRDDVRRVLAGSLEVEPQLQRRAAAARGLRGVDPAPARAQVVPGASRSATVLEVRAPDRPGLLHRLARALENGGVDVRAARISTFGVDAVDVFYVTAMDGRALGATEAARLADALAAAAAAWSSAG